MVKNSMLAHLHATDAKLYKIVEQAFRETRFTLSLLPSQNITSPLASFLEGSALVNSSLTYHDLDKKSPLELLAKERAENLFHAQHAIVRIDGLTSASRVVLLTFLKTGDTVFTFNGRKAEHCSGEEMRYNFVNFSVNADSKSLDFAELRKKAQKLRPKLMIFSPVNYPLEVDYKELANIAHEVGAPLWVDTNQHAGLIAAGLLKSPVPFADVVTFPMKNSMQGSIGAIILSSDKYADQLERAVIDTGHASLKENHFAALAATLKEVGSSVFKSYGETVLENAKAMAAGLTEGGARLYLGGTDTHLVVVQVDDKAGDVSEKLKKISILTRISRVPTDKDGEAITCLRLSSLMPTTRGLTEKEMHTIGKIIAEVITSNVDEEREEKLRAAVAKILINKPIFSNEWLTQDSSLAANSYHMNDMAAIRETADKKRRNLWRRLFNRHHHHQKK